MFHLIPAHLHRIALRIAYRLRAALWQKTGVVSDGVSVIGLDPDGRILLIRHSYGPKGWFLVGGGIGVRETAEEAAHRELREEVNCTIEALALIGVIEEQISGAAHKGHIFSGIIDQTPQPDGREVVEARFFPLHALPEPLSEHTRARLDMWQGNKD